MTRYCFSLLTLVAISSAGFAQKQGDLLDDARRRQEIATQQAETDLKATLRQSGAVSSAEALGMLKKALARLEDNADINPDRKATMIRTLKDRIRLTESSARTAGADETPRAIRQRRAEEEKQLAERDAVTAGLAEIERLQKDGKNKEAAKIAQQLARDYPNNTAVRAANRKVETGTVIQNERGTRTDKENAFAGSVGRDLDKAAMPSKGDVEFDKQRWAELDKIRKDNVLTKKEKALLDALNKPVSPEWRNVVFRDVIEALATASGQPIIIEKKALEDQNISEESPVTFVAPKTVSMRTALRKILGDLGLTYVVKDETIYVTTAAKARELMTTRTYYIGDLVNTGEFSNGVRYWPGVAAKARAETAQAIIDMIKETIDPLSWLGNGGAGSIKFSPIGDALIVRQSAEVHMMLKSSMK